MHALQEPNIGQEKVDNLRLAAHELESLTVVPPKAKKKQKQKPDLKV